MNSSMNWGAGGGGMFENSERDWARLLISEFDEEKLFLDSKLNPSGIGVQLSSPQYYNISSEFSSSLIIKEFLIIKFLKLYAWHTTFVPIESTIQNFFS